MNLSRIALFFASALVLSCSGKVINEAPPDTDRDAGGSGGTSNGAGGATPVGTGGVSAGSGGSVGSGGVAVAGAPSTGGLTSCEAATKQAALLFDPVLQGSHACKTDDDCTYATTPSCISTCKHDC